MHSGNVMGCCTLQEVKSVEVQRFYRPEDISKEHGYRAGFWDIYASAPY